jgi:transcription factor IIIB subunit 2
MINDDKDEDNLYTIDDKSDDEDGGVPLVIIQEEAGPVPLSQQSKSATGKAAQARTDADADEDLEGVSDDEKYDDEKFDEEGDWEDMYEQEI